MDIRWSGSVSAHDSPHTGQLSPVWNCHPPSVPTAVTGLNDGSVFCEGVVITSEYILLWVQAKPEWQRQRKRQVSGSCYTRGVCTPTGVDATTVSTYVINHTSFSQETHIIYINHQETHVIKKHTLLIHQSFKKHKSFIHQLSRNKRLP